MFAGIGKSLEKSIAEHYRSNAVLNLQKDGKTHTATVGTITYDKVSGRWGFIPDLAFAQDVVRAGNQ